MGIDMTPNYGSHCLNIGQDITLKIHAFLPAIKFIVLIGDFPSVICSKAYCKDSSSFAHYVDAMDTLGN